MCNRRQSSGDVAHHAVAGDTLDRLAMPEEAFLHRTAVANELERLVAKKIHSAHEKKTDVA